MTKRLAACSFLLFTCTWAFCAHSLAKENPKLTKIADNVYAQIVNPDGDAVSNSGIVILEHSVLVFRHPLHAGSRPGFACCNPLHYAKAGFLRSEQPCACGPYARKPGISNAQLIASSATRRDVLERDLPSLNRTIGITQSQMEELRRDMSKEADAAQIKRLSEQIKSREDYVQAMSRLKIVAPFVTLDDNLKIQDGKQEARILYLGKGHTDGDVVLFLPAQKIVFAGDLFFNDAIPNVQDASVLAWMKTLEEVLKLDADKFVPGHGGVGSRKDVEKFLAYFQELQSLVKEAIERGDSMEQATNEIVMPAKFSSYRFQNFFPSNIQKMFAELKALQASGAPAEGASKTDTKPK